MNRDNVSLRGSNYVYISTDLIREANAKLIERKYLIEINAQKDSIIEYNKIIIENLETDLKTQYKVNAKLKDCLDTQNRISYACGGVAIIAIVAFLLSISF